MTSTPYTLTPLSAAEDTSDRARYVIDGLLLCGGLTLLFGAPKSGKSTIAAALSAAVATDTRFCDRGAFAGRVAWVSQDRDPRGNRALLRAAYRGQRGDLVGIDRWIMEIGGERFTLDHSASAAALRAVLDEQDVRLLVIDCFRGVSTADENSSLAVREALTRAHELTGPSRAVVLIHHSGHAGGKARGSSDLAACSDILIEVTRARDGIMTLHTVANELEPDSLRAARVQDGDSFVIELCGESGAAAARKPPLHARIIEALRDANTPISKKQIAAQIKATRRTVNPAVDKLVEAGRICKVAGGFALSDAR